MGVRYGLSPTGTLGIGADAARNRQVALGARDIRLEVEVRSASRAALNRLAVMSRRLAQRFLERIEKSALRRGELCVSQHALSMKFRKPGDAIDRV